VFVKQEGEQNIDARAEWEAEQEIDAWVEQEIDAWIEQNKERECDPSPVADSLPPSTEESNCLVQGSRSPGGKARMRTKYHSREDSGVASSDEVGEESDVSSAEEEEEEEWEVERITGCQLFDTTMKWHVKWKDFPDSESTWEPLESLQNAMDAIAEFEAEQNARNEETAGDPGSVF
jgi:hypothetical protein